MQNEERRAVTVVQPPPRREVYEIKVQGRLDESWSGWFDGMTITREHGRDNASVTTLTGAVADQAALRGILARIWDLNLSLVSVTRVEIGSGNEA